MREYRRAILASDDELNVQTQRLAFGVRISISDPSLKRERRINNSAHFTIIYHVTVECGAEGYLWYRYGDSNGIRKRKQYFFSFSFPHVLYFVRECFYRIKSE